MSFQRPAKFSAIDTRPNALEAGIVGWWTFDDGVGCYDFSGTQNNGTLSGATVPVVAEGIIGTALSFANSGFVSCGTSTTLDPGTQAVTGSCWVNFTSLANAFTSVISRINGANNLYSILVNSSGKLAVFCGNGSSSNYNGTGTNTLVTGIWYHIAFVCSPAALVGYVNGLRDGSAVGIGVAAGGAQPLVIGQDTQTAGRLMNGRIDDVRIYNRALSPGEIHAIYAEGASYEQGQPEGEMPALIPGQGPGLLMPQIWM